MLTPLPPEEWTDENRGALDGTVEPERRNPEGAGNALATLVRHPALTAKFLPFNTYLMTESTLPPRIRELVILRTAHHHSCDYEWRHHVALGAQVGLTDDDIVAARTGCAADAFDQAVLAAVDEMHGQARIAPQTWAALGERLDDRQRMDLIFTAGGYGVLATALNTFGVEPEEWAGKAESYLPAG